MVSEVASQPNHGWATVESPVAGYFKFAVVNSAGSVAYTVTVDNCQIMGVTNSIYNDDGGNSYTTYVGASLLDGAVTGTGTEICVFSYDETYAALDASCQ